jgi:hypothetical protein
MPRIAFTVAVLMLAAASASAAEPAAAVPAPVAAQADGPIRDPGGVKGYAVHEWGVSTIHPDLEMANAALAAEWADCPKELYRTEPPSLRNLPIRVPRGRPPTARSNSRRVTSWTGWPISCRHRGSTGIGQPEAGVAVEPNLGFGSDRQRRQGPWMALPP